MPHRLSVRWWMAPALVVIVAGHAVVPYLFTHATTSAAIVSGLVAFMIAKHLGMAAVVVRSLFGRFRRRARHRSSARVPRI